MSEAEVTLYHGCEESFVRLLEQGADLYYAYRKTLPTAIFSNDIRYAILFAGGFTKERSYVTEWLIPISLLTLLDEGVDNSRWYVPNQIVEDLSEVPRSVTNKVAHSPSDYHVVFMNHKYYVKSTEISKLI